MSEALPNTNIESAADFECNELYLATNSAPGDGDEYFSEMIIPEDNNNLEDEEEEEEEAGSIVDVSAAAAEREGEEWFQNSVLIASRRLVTARLYINR